LRIFLAVSKRFAYADVAEDDIHTRTAEGQTNKADIVDVPFLCPMSSFFCLFLSVSIQKKDIFVETVSAVGYIPPLI